LHQATPNIVVPPAFPTCANIPTADLYTVFAGLGIMPQQDASQFGSTGYVYDEWPCDPANYGGGSPSVGCPYATIQAKVRMMAVEFSRVDS